SVCLRVSGAVAPSALRRVAGSLSRYHPDPWGPPVAPLTSSLGPRLPEKSALVTCEFQPNDRHKKARLVAGLLFGKTLIFGKRLLPLQFPHGLRQRCPNGRS